MVALLVDMVELVVLWQLDVVLAGWVVYLGMRMVWADFPLRQGDLHPNLDLLRHSNRSPRHCHLDPPFHASHLCLLDMMLPDDPAPHMSNNCL